MQLGTFISFLFVLFVIALLFGVFIFLTPKSSFSEAIFAGIRMLTAGHDQAPNNLDPSMVSVTGNSNQFTTTLTGSNLFEGSVNCNSSSMGYLLNCNSTMVLETLNPNDTINLGDIIVYNAQWSYFGFNFWNGSIMHAVHRYNAAENCWYFLGDNNLIEDPECVNQSSMVARVVEILPTKSYLNGS